MNPEVLQYRLPRSYSVSSVREILNHAMKLQADSNLNIEQTYLDTFDWRLYTSGHVLVFESNAWGSQLIWRDLDWSAPIATVDTDCQPRWARQLPAGSFRDRIKPLVELRALLPLSRRRIRRHPMRLINAAGKTVLRVQVEKIQAPNMTKLGVSRLWVLPVKGYPKPLHRLLDLLDSELGLARIDTDAALECFSHQGIAPYDRATRFRAYLDRDTDSNPALKLLLHTLVDSIELNAAGVVDNVDTECLHDLRVSIRKTRSALSQAKQVLPGRTVSRFLAEFGWLGHITGSLRDIDVYRLDLDRQLARLPSCRRQGLLPLLDFLRVRESQERKRVVKALESARFQRLITDWGKILGAACPARTRLRRARQPVSEFATSRIRKAYKRVLKQGHGIEKDSPDEHLHELRKSCKTLRYLLEMFESLYSPASIKTVIKTLKRLQDNLGLIQDSHVQSQTLRQYAEQMRQAGELTEESGTAIETMVQSHVRQSESARREFAACFREFTSPSPRAIFKRLLADRSSA